MRLRWSAALALIAVPLAPSRALADEPARRHGFTVEAGASLAAMHVADDDPGSYPGVSSRGTYGGYWPLSASVGAFVVRRVAVMAHFTGAAYLFETGTAQYTRSITYLGPQAQVWITDDFDVAGGAGVAVWDPGDARRPADRMMTGWAFSLRGEWAFIRTPHHAFKLGVELLPAFLPRSPSSVTSALLGVTWQYY